jgi:hypothetical protein
MERLANWRRHSAERETRICPLAVPTFLVTRRPAERRGWKHRRAALTGIAQAIGLLRLDLITSEWNGAAIARRAMRNKPSVDFAG